jgi:hypothetical protein
MASRNSKPTSPARRFYSVQTFDEITSTKPHKPLLEPLHRSGGRNNKGETTSWWRGGGHKRNYRVIDFKRVRRAVNSMMRDRYGRIVLIGSVVGLMGNPGQVNYSASKSALVGMARSITREVGARGITANVIAPGFITTDMTAELGEDVAKQYASTIPAKRFGSTEDVAAAALFLASDEAGYVSGAVLPVDGGLGMGH